MKVERATFLGLTAALFAGGCNSSSNQSPPVAIPNQPAPQQSATTLATLKTAEDKQADQEARVAKDQEDDDLLYDRVTPDETSSNRACGWVDPEKVGRLCTDPEPSSSSPNACKLRQCNGLGILGYPEKRCESYRTSLKPSVAARALRCLERLKSSETCSPCNINRCGEIALKRACLDPSADATCVQIASKCKSVSMAECRGYLSGMNAQGRAKMLACLSTQEGCGFGIFSCSEGL